MSFFDIVFKRNNENSNSEKSERSHSFEAKEEEGSSPPPEPSPIISEPRSRQSGGKNTTPSVGGHHNDVSKEGFRSADHNAAARQVFLAPLPRRRMVMPEGVLSRMRVPEKNEGWTVNGIEGPRAPTPLSTLSATMSTQIARDTIVVTEAELAGVKRLAGFNAAVRKDSIPITLPTSGYQLNWLHDPKKHAKPARPSTLLNMRTDYLLPKTGGGGGGGEHDSYPFIDSPRSVLVFVRNGTHPMDLQRRPPVASDPLGVFRERLRVEELERLQSEYAAICEVLPQSTVDAFFSFSSDQHNDSSEVGPFSIGEGSTGSSQNEEKERKKSQIVKPILEKDDNGIYRVTFHFEVSTAAAAVEEQMDRTRANLRTLLEAEIALTKVRTETLREQQERSLAAARKHDAQIAERQQQRHVAATIKAIATKQRATNRAEAAERLRQKAVQAYNEKQERLAVVEAQMEEEMLNRQAERRLREEEREEKRLQTLAIAADKEAKLLQERMRIVERKNASCEEALEAKAKTLQIAKDKRAAYERSAQSRKEAIDLRSEAEREERRIIQEKREATAEAQIANLREKQQTMAAVRSLASLQKLVYMDECRQEGEARERQRREELVAQRAVAEDRQQRLLTVLEQRRKGRHQAKEEIRLEKALRVERQSRIDQFTSLMTADRMLESKARAEAITDAREQMIREARKEREVLSQWRHKALTEAKKEAEEQERAATLGMFNKAHPSDAVIYREKNARAAASLSMQPLRKRKPLSYSQGAEPTELLE